MTQYDVFNSYNIVIYTSQTVILFITNCILFSQFNLTCLCLNSSLFFIGIIISVVSHLLNNNKIITILLKSIFFLLYATRWHVSVDYCFFFPLPSHGTNILQ